MTLTANSILSLNGSTMPTEQFAFSLVDVDEVLYQQEMPGTSYSESRIPIINGDIVTVGMPDSFLFSPALLVTNNETSDLWQYAFVADPHTFTGIDDLSLSLGDDLSIEPMLIDPPYKLGDETGIVRARVTNNPDFELTSIVKNYFDQHANFDITDPLVNPVTGFFMDDLLNIDTMYSFAIPPDRPVGTWLAAASLDTGPFDGVITGSTPFGVYDADPTSNDDIANATIIDPAALPYSMTNLDTMGSTTSVNDP